MVKIIRCNYFPKRWRRWYHLNFTARPKDVSSDTQPKLFFAEVCFDLPSGPYQRCSIVDPGDSSRMYAKKELDCVDIHLISDFSNQNSCFTGCFCVKLQKLHLVVDIATLSGRMGTKFIILLVVFFVGVIVGIGHGHSYCLLISSNNFQQCMPLLSHK